MALLFVLTACEDPDDTFDPQNPALSVDAIVGGVNSTGLLIDGLERQLALTFNEITPLTEIASDNYENTRTFFNQALDNLDIDFRDADIRDLLFDIMRMRELALLGQTVVAPGDPAVTPNAMAELKFFEGLSYLLGAELYTTIPAEAGGRALTVSENLAEAVTAFTDGLTMATDDATIGALTLARARAYYYLGDATNAVADAQTLLAQDPMFIRFVNYDANDGPTSNIQDALWDRGTFDDLQPLPRLDFLDPKFDGDEQLEESPIPYLKSEEAHLIIIEAAIANNDLPAAQMAMNDLLALVDSRPTESINELAEGRPQANPGSRPDNSSVTVAASPGAPFRTGLVLDRTNATVVPTISGTSVTSDMVAAISTADEALYTNYLMRQEIFMAEGRRMTDLGIRFVVSERESLLNPNIRAEDTTPDLPSFMAALAGTFDSFTYDVDAGTVVIDVDLNEVIVANKTSDFVVPFE